MPDFGDGSGRDFTHGTPDPYAPSVANGQITPEQWAEMQAKRKKDAILGVLGVLGATTGLGAVGMMGGAGAAGGAAGSATINGLPMAPYAATATMAPPAVGMGAGAAGAAATGAGAAGAAGAAGGTASTIANAGKAAGGMFGGMDSKTLMGLLAALTGTVGALKTNAPQTAPTSATTDPQMQEVLSMMMSRMKKAEPLQDSALAMANGLLPTQYQNGGRG